MGGVSSNLVLASGSPRRKEILRQIGLRFRVRVSGASERAPAPFSPRESVALVALGKARKVAASVRSGVVLGADTIVVARGRVFGKPRSTRDAVRMLRALSGRTHSVWTGIAAIARPAGQEAMDAVETRVRFRRLSDTEILAYVETGESKDKAGAYAIQGRAAAFVTSISGDFYNVVGLPVARTLALLAKVGFRAPENASGRRVVSPTGVEPVSSP